MIRPVGISEMFVSRDPEDVLVTYSLGSCLGLSLFDPVAGVGGLIHCMLPLSSLDAAKAKAAPCMFTDTGIPHLLEAVFRAGALRDRLILKAAGAATLLDPKGRFRIGERNQAIMRKVLWKNELLLSGEDLGGLCPRTLSLFIKDGRTTVRSGGIERDL